MPTEDEIREIEEATRELQGLFKVVEERETEMIELYKASALLWANISEVHKKRADWYFSFIKDAKDYIGSLIMNMDQAKVPHHAIVFHNKLAKIVEIVEAKKK